MSFPENCTDLSPEALFADRPEVLRRYKVGIEGENDVSDIHVLADHAVRKGLESIEQKE